MHLLAIGKDWWLPPNYSVHGREIDHLFNWFFWITTSILIVVQFLLVLFMLKYRARPGRAATYIHGNSRLEIVWTAIPAVILAVLALGSKRVWDDYRNSPTLQEPNHARILVIGQQFKWTVIYPGLDGKFGKYLVFPKPTDKLWPAGTKAGYTQGVPGPASLPPADAISAISQWINQDNEHQMGKDFSDEDGKDDVVSSPGAPIYVPVDRPVELLLESKDVIHDFYLPNFRSQLYAVPGMRGQLVFTPTETTEDLQRASRETVDVETLLADGSGDRFVSIDAGSPGADNYNGWRYPTGKKDRSSIVRDGKHVSKEMAAQLKAKGITRIALFKPAPFEIVCAQLCGAQHSSMRGEMIVLPQAEFDKKYPSAAHTSAR